MADYESLRALGAKHKFNVDKALAANKSPDEIAQYLVSLDKASASNVPVTALDAARAEGNRDEEIKQMRAMKQLGGSTWNQDQDTNWVRMGAQMLGEGVGVAGSAALDAAATPVAGGANLMTAPLRAAAAGALGSAAAGQIYDLGADALARFTGAPLPWESAKTPLERFSESAIDAGLGMVGGPAMEGVAIGAKKLGNGLMSKIPLFKASKPYLQSQFPVQEGVDHLGNLAATRRVGIPDQAHLVMESPTGATMTHAMEKSLTVGTKFDELKRKTFNRGSDFLDEIITQISGGNALSRDEVGRRINEGVSASKDRLVKEYKDAFDARDALIPDTDVVPLQNVHAILDNMTKKHGSDPLYDWIDPATVKQITDTWDRGTKVGQILNPDGSVAMTVRDINKPMGLARDMKSLLGKVYQKANPDIRDGMLKEIENAFRTDIDAYAKSLGGPAQEATEKANSLFRAFKGDPKVPLSGHEERLDKFLNKDAGATYNYTVGSTGNDGDRLRRAFEYLPDQTKSELSGTLLNEMRTRARSNDGNSFSYSNLFGELNKLSDDARDVLFDPKKYPEARKDLEALRVVSGLIDKYGGTANSSNTSHVQSWMNAGLWPAIFGGGGAFISPGASLKGVAAGAAIQGGKLASDLRVHKLLTDPDFIMQLAKGAKAEIARKPLGLAHQIGNLVALGKEKPHLQDEIMQLIGTMGVPADTSGFEENK